MNKMYSFDEIGLIPKNLSTIEHRGDVIPFIGTGIDKGKLPIFVSPMTCILSAENIQNFEQAKVIPILPVTPDISLRRTYSGWKALSVKETEQLFVENKLTALDNILIDCASGHMVHLYRLVSALKEALPKITIMVGNIANPATYLECCFAGVDYVRVGIGGGSGCTTSVLTGMHASLPWLLEGIQEIKKNIVNAHRDKIKCITKIVADGGVNTIDRAIKALALGADYVMMGRCFASCREACGESRVTEQGTLERFYYGQSSDKGQMDRFGYVKSKPEGCGYWIPVEHSLESFLRLFEDCLRSAMSYAGAFTLDDFIGMVDYNIMSKTEYDNYIK